MLFEVVVYQSDIEVKKVVSFAQFVGDVAAYYFALTFSQHKHLNCTRTMNFRSHQKKEYVNHLIMSEPELFFRA